MAQNMYEVARGSGRWKGRRRRRRRCHSQLLRDREGEGAWLFAFCRSFMPNSCRRRRPPSLSPSPSSSCLLGVGDRQPRPAPPPSNCRRLWSASSILESQRPLSLSLSSFPSEPRPDVIRDARGCFLRHRLLPPPPLSKGNLGLLAAARVPRTPCAAAPARETANAATWSRSVLPALPLR